MRSSSIALVLALAMSSRVQSAEASAVQFLSPDPTTGRSLAVKVAAQPLAHTNQVYGDSPGTALDRLGTLLRQAGSGLAQVVKLNAYLARATDESAVRKAVAARFAPDHLPALTCVVTPLSEPGATVALDAVASTTLAPGGDEPLLPKTSAPVAVLPASGAVYISGQAEKGADLRESTRKTMESLGATLKWLNLDWRHVVHVKAFMQPMSDAAAARDEIGHFFPQGHSLPVALVEWQGGGTPIEIEIVAASPDSGTSRDAEYLTPPGMKASPVYCRVARIPKSPRIYFSGMISTQGTDDQEQVRAVFAELKSGLEKTGSDLRHLVKATYYVASDGVSKALNDLRPNYYDPQRPPAASKAMVTGVGAGPATLVMDMIAIPAPAK